MIDNRKIVTRKVGEHAKNGQTSFHINMSFYQSGPKFIMVLMIIIFAAELIKIQHGVILLMRQFVGNTAPDAGCQIQKYHLLRK